jgi:hypothetical protein
MPRSRKTQVSLDAPLLPLQLTLRHSFATHNLSFGIQVNVCNVPEAVVEFLFLNDGYVPREDLQTTISHG